MMRECAINKINKAKPRLVVGSPMCTDWGTMMNFNWPRLSSENDEKRQKEAGKHYRFCVNVYRHQINEGLDYLHEHPMNAKPRQPDQEGVQHTDDAGPVSVRPVHR